MNQFLDFFSLRRKYLVYNLTLRNLKMRYRGAYAGIIWSVLVPVLSASVYYFVFKYVMKVQAENYFLTMVSDIFPWTFLSTAIIQGCDSLIANKPLMSKVYMPPVVFPFAETLTQFLNFILSLPVLIAVIVYNDKLSTALLLLPLMYMLLFLLAYPIVVIMSVVFVFLRDLKHIIGVIIQLLFYATPIIYRAELLPEKYHYMTYINPFWYLFKSIQTITVDQSFPVLTDVLVILIWILGLMIIAFSVYKYFRTRIVETI